MGAGVSARRRRTPLVRDKDFIASPVAKWWDGRERNWIHEAWDILQPLSEGKWWAYAALCELICDFERAAKQIAKIILSEVCVEEHSRILKKRPDGKYRTYHMEIVVIPESETRAWKGMSDELAVVRALWRCRSYYFVPPILCIIDVCGLRMCVRALPPEGSRVIYGPGAAKMQSKAAQQLQNEVERVATILNLKSHQAFPSSHAPSLQGKDEGGKRRVGEDGTENDAGDKTSVQGRKSMGFSFFGIKDERFQTCFGHAVVICTTTGGLRFMEMVSDLFPYEVGPDMERIRKEAAAKKQKRAEEAKAKASKQLAEQREREDAEQRERDGEQTLYERFRDTALEFLGLQKQENLSNFSLHQLQYRCRELGIKWTGSRFELIPRIEQEMKRQAELKKEREAYERQVAQNKFLRDEKKKKEQERLDRIQTENPKFGLTGDRRPLRPEFVRTCPHALNSDVHCSWESTISSHEGDRMEVEKATEYCQASLIPQLAVELQQRFCNDGRRGKAEEKLTCKRLKQTCREKGVRARDFGKLHAAARSTHLRCIILTEMVFRLCKMLLRAVMLDALRSCRGLSQQPIHDAVCEFLRLVFGESEESVKFWDGMQQKLEQHFVGFQNLTAAQIANLAEWEKAANILQNFEFHAEVERYKQKDELHRTRFGRPLSDLETTRLKLVEGTLRRAALQERQLRHAIDSAFVHVEHQCDKKQALDRLAASCGIRFNHGMDVDQVLSECKAGILAPTDIKKIGLVSHTMCVGDFAMAIQTVMRANHEIEHRRLKDLRISIDVLEELLPVAPDDWLLSVFYADNQLLLSDIDAAEHRYDRLHAAFQHYCRSVALNRLNVHSMYEAGDVMYRMLAMRFDSALEQEFLKQCIEYRMEETSRHEWNTNIRKWAGMVWRFATDSKGPKKQLRGSIAGRLLGLWIDYQREHHPHRYKDLNLMLVDGLEPSDVFAVLEAAKQYMPLGKIVLDAEVETKKPTGVSRFSIQKAVSSLFARDHKEKMMAPDGVLDLDPTPFISDDGIGTCIEIVGSVQHFKAHKCKGMSGDPIQLLAEQCRSSLTSFELAESPHVSQDSIEAIVMNCESLIDFSVEWMETCMTNKFVTKMSVHWGFLASLDISENKDIKDEGIRSIANNCPNLIAVDFSGLSNITDASVTRIARCCLRLRTLVLQGCRKLSGDSVAEFALRTHCLWNVKKNVWLLPDGKVVLPRKQRAMSLAPPLTRQKQNSRSLLKKEKEEDIIPWAIGNCDAKSEWVDMTGAVKLVSELSEQGIEDISREYCYMMFDELDGAKKWKVDAGHQVRIERARRWFNNKVDTEVIEMDFRAEAKDLDAMFELYARTPPGEPAEGHPKSLSLEEMLNLLNFLNICPAYFSAYNVASYMEHFLHKRKEAEEKETGNTDVLMALGFKEPKRLLHHEYRKVMIKIAKNLKIEEANLGRITRAWLHKPPVSMQSLIARLDPRGEFHSTLCSEIPRHNSHDLVIHLSVGAIKLAKDTMEVLSQKGMEFQSIQLFISTSWGKDFKGKILKNYTRETYKKQLKESVFKQEFWLFNTHEEFLIDIPVSALVGDDDWRSGNLYIQLAFNYFDYKKAKRYDGHQQQRIATLILMMPKYIETDGPVEWLPFGQFFGQADRRDAAAMANSHKMPPQLRMRYRVLREGKADEAKHKVKALHHYELHQSVGEAALAAVKSIMPGYMSKKIDTLAEDVTQQAVEIVILDTLSGCIRELFHGRDVMDELNLSSCLVDDDGVQELLHWFHGLHTLNLANCPLVRPSTVAKWADHLRNLVHLDLSHTKEEYQPEAYLELVLSCPHLETLNVCANLGVTDAAILQIPEYMPFLSSLNLSGCTNISSMGFTFLSEATSLTRLKLGGCDKVSEKAFLQMISGLTNLTKLNASDLSLMTDKCVDKLMTTCSHINSINVCNNMLLTSESLSIFARFGHGLQSLHIGGNSSYNSEALGQLIVNAEGLVKLKMTGCDGLTDDALIQLAEHGASLEFIDLCSTSTTTSALKELITRLPGVKIVCDNIEDPQENLSMVKQLQASKLKTNSKSRKQEEEQQNGQDSSDDSEMDEYLSQQEEAKKAVGRSS